MLRKLILIAVLGSAFSQSCWAQGTGGTGTTGGGTTTADPGGDTGTGSGGNQNQGGGNVQGLSDAFQLGDLLTFGQDFSRESVYENNRIQPFVGPSTANILHPRSQIDPAGSTLGSSAGGGFSFSANSQNRARTGATGFGGSGTANQQGSTVARRGVRSALRYTPIAHPLGDVVVSNFQSRLIRLPALQGVGSIDMKVENRVAILSGTVATTEQIELIARQAELEPGVDRVVVELRVGQ